MVLVALEPAFVWSTWLHPEEEAQGLSGRVLSLEPLLRASYVPCQCEAAGGPHSVQMETLGSEVEG